MTNEEKTKEISRGFSLKKLSATPVKCCEESALAMAEWKDEQFDEEKKELLGLVNMLPVDDHNQTIIEDLKALLQ